MVSEYSDFENLCSAIQRTIPSILEKYVLPEVEDIVEKSIRSGIYSYKPKVYDRTWSLVDRDNYIHWISGNTLYDTVESDGDPHGGFFSERRGSFLNMLERGDLGWFSWRLGHNKKKVMFRRLSISPAQGEIDKQLALETGPISAAIKRGIKNAVER